MSGLPETGHGWAMSTRPSILTALSVLGAVVFTAMLVMLLAEALDAHRRRR
jgi:hypothetical protein